MPSHAHSAFTLHSAVQSLLIDSRPRLKSVPYLKFIVTFMQRQTASNRTDNQISIVLATCGSTPLSRHHTQLLQPFSSHQVGRLRLRRGGRAFHALQVNGCHLLTARSPVSPLTIKQTGHQLGDVCESGQQPLAQQFNSGGHARALLQKGVYLQPTSSTLTWTSARG